MSEEESSPDKWAHDAWRASVDEVRLYFRTLIAFSHSPGDFTRRWVAGEKGWMSPLAYMGMSVLLVAPAQFLLFRRLRPYFEKMEAQSHLPMTGDGADIVRSILPYFTPIALGLLMHPFLRLVGSKRSLFTTVGALFYIYGPMLMMSWLLLPYQYFVLLSPRALETMMTNPHAVGLRTQLLSMIPVPVQFYFSIAGLRGAHGLSRGRTALAFVLGFLLFAVVLGGGVLMLGLSLKHAGKLPPPAS